MGVFYHFQYIIVLIYACSFPTRSLILFQGLKEVHIEKLEQCVDETTPVQLVSVLLNYQRSATMTVNAEFNVKQSVGGKIIIIVELSKCLSKSEPDSCEYNSKHKFILNCKQLFTKNKIWSDFVQHITNLPESCPLPPATYKIVDAPISLKNMGRLPLAVGFWKITTTGFMGKDRILCLSKELDIRLAPRKRTG